MESFFISIVDWLSSTMGGVGEIIASWITNVLTILILIPIFMSPLLAICFCIAGYVSLVFSIIHSVKKQKQNLYFSISICLYFWLLYTVFFVISLAFLESVLNPQIDPCCPY